MKQKLKSYYELNVIPSIVLAGLMGLGWYACEGDASIPKMIEAFCFYLAVMTAVDFVNSPPSR